MCSASLRLALAALLLSAGAAEARELRVCADPNNLPFSNQAGEGFENRIVELLAKDLGATVRYTWWAQRRGFVRSTIRAGLCDLLAGVPPQLQGLWTTAPYYGSSYVFVTRQEVPPVTSFEDPRLATLKVGVQLVGDDGSNTPPAHELARRGIVDKVRGYSLYGDYSRPNPPARIIDALVAGEIDVALAWGPLAGYFAQRSPMPLTAMPVEADGPRTGLPMRFAIAMAVRKEDQALGPEIDAALQRHAGEIGALLAEYGVPLATVPSGRADDR